MHILGTAAGPLWTLRGEAVDKIVVTCMIMALTCGDRGEEDVDGGIAR